MNKIIIFVIGAVVGAAAGAAGAWVFTKDKYQKISDEEIASVKEHFTCPRTTSKPSEVEEHDTLVASENAEQLARSNMAKNKVDIMEYAKVMKKHNYSSYSDTKPGKTPAPAVVPDSSYEEAVNERPYIISPDDFAEKESYEPITLMLYADGVLTDDDEVPVADIEAIIPADYADYFGQFERDAVYVRNDQLQCDYEILKDERNYADLVKPRPIELKPHQMEE